MLVLNKLDYYSKENQLNARREGRYDEVMGSLTKCPFCNLKSKYVIKRLSGMYLTANLFPYTNGHLLIVSQRHIENISELTKKEWQAVLLLTKLAQKLLKKHLSIKDFALVCHHGYNSGRSLKHFHISLIPNSKQVLKKEYQLVDLEPLKLSKLLQ